MRSPRSLALVVLLAAACSKPSPVQAPAPSDPAPAATAPPPPPVIELTQEGELTIDETAIPVYVTTELIASLLGKPDRVIEAGEELWVYDRLGIVAYHRRETDRILDVMLVYGPHSWEFQPSEPFRGKITIAGVPIDGTTTADGLDATLPKMPDGYMYGYGELEPTFTFDDDGVLSDLSLGFDSGDAYE